MPNYANGKIYQIISPNHPLPYIGSTTQRLCNRMAEHRIHKSCSSRILIEAEGAYIELIEYYPCDNKEQLNRREGEIMRSRECVNQRIAGRTLSEYRETNREALSAQAKEYYEANREAINAKHTIYRETNREAINAYREDNREAFRARDKANYGANREAIRAQRKANYEANPEAILAQCKIYREANKEAISARNKARYVLKKTKSEATSPLAFLETPPLS